MSRKGLRQAVLSAFIVAGLLLFVSSHALAVKPMEFGITVPWVKIGEGYGGSDFWSNGRHGIAARGGKVFAAWAHSCDGGPHCVSFVRSLDGGVTWSGMKTISKSASTFAANIAVSADGNTIHVAWDFSDDDAMYSASTNGGNTWSTPVAVNRDYDPYVDGSWSGSIALDETRGANGTVHVAWASAAGDVYDSRSADNGLTWTHKKVNVNTSGNTDTIISINSQGDIMLAWTANQGITGTYFSKSTDGGSNWLPNEVLVTTQRATTYLTMVADPLSPLRAYIVYPQAGSNTCSYTNNGGATWQVSTVSQGEYSDPSVAVGPSGEVTVAWENRIARSYDYGVSWATSINSMSELCWYSHLSVDENDKAHIMCGAESGTFGGIRYTKEK